MQILLNQTPFYAESGGQVGDAGKLSHLNGFEADVQDTSKQLGKLHLLRATVRQGTLKIGDTLTQKVDEERRRAAIKRQASLRRHALEVELCLASVRAAARGRKMIDRPLT